MPARLKRVASHASSQGPASPLDDLILLLPGYDPHDQAGDCSFDADSAQQAIDFIEECIRHAKGTKGKDAGERFLLAPWQKGLVANLFGWKRPDGTRRYRECLIYVAKKNGKTALAAAILLCVMMTDGEYGAELYSAAASRDQAALIFSHAAGMVRQEPELSSRLTVYGAKGGSQQRVIVYEAQASSYKCLSADAGTADGVSPHFAVIDELHRHADSELAEVLQKSTAARAQPMVLYTSTADYNRPSLCNTMLKRARQVRDNKGDPDRAGYDPGFLPVVYEATKDDDYTEPETWAKANPNLGVTVAPEFMERECKKAQETPSELNNFLRLHLNIVTDADQSWLQLDKWDACAGDVSEALLAGRRCYGGLDLSNKVDVTAFVLVFPPTDEDPKWRVLPRFWIPGDNARQRERRDHVKYETWERLGLIRFTEGNVVDYDFIKEQILDDARAFDLVEIAYDPWNATQIALQIQADGANPVEFGQGFRSMSEPTKELEKLILAGDIAHGGNEVLRWMAGNVAVESDPAGNLKPSKRKSTERIDGIVALIMALGRALVESEESVISVRLI